MKKILEIPKIFKYDQTVYKITKDKKNYKLSYSLKMYLGNFYDNAFLAIRVGSFNKETAKKHLW